jgi:two-component system, sensor histidine kinase LadS
MLRLWPWLALMAFAGPVAVAAPEVRLLEGSAGDPPAAAVINGSLDSQFTGSGWADAAARGQPVWLRIRPANRDTHRIAVLSTHVSHFQRLQMFAGGSDGGPLAAAADLPEFAGAHHVAFIVPAGDAPLYARFESPGKAAPRFDESTLAAVQIQGAARARNIALAFGALTAMAAAALLIWVILAEPTFFLYGWLFAMQALYVAYFSGQAFQWPLLSYAAPLTHHAWNVPLALSGAAACLFTREIADLQRFSPRVYSVFGWLAGAFMLLTVSNLAKLAGLSAWVNAIGNVLFLGTAVFALVVAFMAWRRGSRPAGWFLLAWGQMEAFTIAATIRLLAGGGAEADRLLYDAEPFSMVLAGVLIALALADRLREQRVALTDAERRAQTDSLTGVLNRRSLIERLEAACVRARARGLPISLLFIDLDHFKQINDSFGHQAGDACLAAIIAPIQAELRQSDVIGRYGGEEFVVILSSADAAAAQPIAQRILERVASVQVDGFGAPITLTCSIGVATSDTLGVWGEHLIAQADAAVYAAKRSGRNCVQFAAPLAA